MGKPRGVRVDERDSDADEREKGYECECYDGYRSGIAGACSIECPGGYATPCSNRGRCVGSVAPIEPWEAEDALSMRLLSNKAILLILVKKMKFRVFVTK